MRSLSQLFDPHEIHSISFALASEIGATYRPSPNESHQPLALLINTESLYQQMSHQQISNNLRIFPTAFSPRVCSFQSSAIPISYINPVSKVLRILRKENPALSDDSLKISTMQGYSSIKQHVYSTQDTFSLDRSTYIDAHTLLLSHISE